MPYQSQNTSRPTPRPDILTFICIFLLTAAAVSIYFGVDAIWFIYKDSDYDGDFRYYGLIVLPFLTGIPGWFMLRRQNWARVFFLVVLTPFLVGSAAVLFEPDSTVVLIIIASLFLLLLSCLYLSTRTVVFYFTRDRSLMKKIAAESAGQRKKRERYEY